ncbi:hypothetical protein [Jiangella mangrovi]|uniref:Thiamine pyrophosphate-dependent acetolactate synthase large subunit-like protein n=1 Tax=Jiangella mangrovi TaxID=1524084 RepID=A0A7W9GX48_9ACTN|nr:hypothetical protein [Jiangella mangrovi]MBB5791670.1 thiamine pyrophosphate-dependent acetolactate synthase large subunit-like protein [Jiangella mangrovi]
MTQELYVAIVSSSPAFHATAAAALGQLAGPSRWFAGALDKDVFPTAWPEPAQALASRANAYLDEALPDARVELVEVARLSLVEDRLRQVLPAQATEPGEGPRPWTAAPTVLLLVDATTAVPGEEVGDRLDTVVETLAKLRQHLGIGVSPYSVVVYDELDEDQVYSRTVCTSRRLPDDDWVLAAEVLTAFTDLVQARHVNRRALLPDTEPAGSLALALTDFLTEQSGPRWALHFFTGTLPAKLIQDATTIAQQAGNPVLRGPNEHSLACGALARWQLDQAPFLLVATAGMVDELKGTLANLRDSQARGFIVFGETAPGGWQPFQGTVHDDEDARAVFAARGLPCFYLTEPERLAEELAAAFRAYHRRSGPVVLLTAPSVLRMTGPLDVPKVTVAAAHPQADEDTVDAVARILNEEPGPVLWQCGNLTEDERELVYDLAHRAGVALVDSLGRPGTVARYHQGREVEEFVGTMSIYGCSPQVWSLLHPGGRRLGHGDHALFFLKSRITDLATPFPEKTLYQDCRIVQVTDTPAHVAPFTDLPVVEQLSSFLRRLAPRVAPGEWVLRSRREAIARARRATGDPLAAVPSVPMSHEHFFTALDGVLRGLITGHGYEYTGFYDVGRGGISAIRNLARTGPGFSGWYGRALMGDALQAIPSIALTRPGNVLGFIGDGAARLVPSSLPSLAQQLRHEHGRVDGNISIFFLLNGGFSIIRSNRELQHAATADAQMSLLTPVEPPWRETWAGTTVTHERLVTVDPGHLADRLLTPSSINLFSVYLAHDNEGDDIMPTSRKSWRLR